MTLDEVYKEWLPVKLRQVKKTSLATYKLSYDRHVRPTFGNAELMDLKKKTIMPFFWKLLDEGISAKYCTDICIIIKMLIRFAGDELEEDVPDTTWKLALPSKNKTAVTKIERYTPAECKKITDYAVANPSPRNLGILLTLCSGMRIGEICALQWKDVDINNKLIHVNKTIMRVYLDEIEKKTEIEIGTPKTTSSDRHIPILKDIFPLVKKFASLYNPEYYVCSCAEKYIEPRTFRNYYKSFILDKVKLDHCIKFHGLRHTFATMLIENKMDIKTVSTILGHSDISTTLDVYTHPSEETKRDAINVGLKRIFK